MAKTSLTIVVLFTIISTGFTYADKVFTFCPDNWLSYEGSCYYFHHTKTSFVEAEHSCQNLESNLVHVNNVQERDFLRDHLNHQLPVAYWWMGLSDDDIEGQFRWTDNQPLTFTDWFPGEPNNANGVEDCAMFDHNHNFKWNDVACNQQYFSICELKSESQGAGSLVG
ncbi:perlucin-like [Mya arenaria]|uniref:perlucin-like n=1 Tax=Mya arenaria TaxID=6604 RepID=UPI0022E07433|nr:perlucin-like [Mya arenaria]XP_052763181.1 perlucin-like [Mya arenaria]XP_052763183.1 perlucin-like [Mya arenaria]XP_052763184.1 perlucin-like [Mya arenaria]